MSKENKKNNAQFEFGLDFQEAILNFVILSKKGHKAIQLIEDSYFTTLHHAVIFKIIKSFFKQKNKIIAKLVLKENLRVYYRTRDADTLIPSDKLDIESITDRIYTTTITDPDFILESIIKFAKYVELKDLQENHNLEDYTTYDNYQKKVDHIMRIGMELDEDIGHLLVAGAKDRVMERSLGYDQIETPWWQLNRLINAGSVNKGILIMLMSRQKRFKTGMMLNWAKGELGRRKIGFYVDLENGTIAISMRSDQGILKLKKEEVLSGEYDDKMMRTYRKYKRIKSELAIRRFPAYRTTTVDIAAWLQLLERNFGIRPSYGIVDYGDLMAATTGRQEDDKRISDVYIDLKNLANDFGLDYIITASHVKRDKETQKRAATKYIGEDVAKAVDKVRHCDIVLGLQENEDEKEAGVMRVEIVDQRDGVSEGNMMFWVDIQKQLAREFTRGEVSEYNKQAGRDENGAKKKAIKDSDI